MEYKLTIITINYNNRDGLERTMNSVFSQTYKDFEYVIIDGGSTDGSKELLESNTQKISYWISEPDKGIYNAMNKGIKVAKGEYLLFLNSGDDFVSSTSLANVIIDLDEHDIVCFDIKVINGEISFITDIPDKLSLGFFIEGTLPHQSTFIKRKAFDIVGVYDESLKIVSDWKWFVHAFCYYRLSYRKINFYYTNFYMDGISSENSLQQVMGQEKEFTLKNDFYLFYEDYKQLLDLKAYKEDLGRSRLFKIFLKVKSFFALFKK